MTDTTGTDVERAQSRTPAQQRGEAELARFLQMTESEVDDIDPEVTTLAIITEVLAAETIDELIGGRDAVSSKDYVGKPFKLVSVKFQRSTLEGEGPGFYAVLTGATRDGEKLVITSGARQIMAQAWKLREMGWLPVDLLIGQTSRPSSSGFFPQWLERAPVSF